MVHKPLPGVFQLFQIGPNAAVFGDAVMKAPNFPTMEETFQSLMTSPVMKDLFPNVTDASMFFGQMMERSLEDFGAAKIVKNFVPSTNLITYGNNMLPGGAGSTLVSKGR